MQRTNGVARENRIDRASEQAHAAERIRSLMSEPLVIKYLETRQAQLIRQALDALRTPGNELARMASFELKAFEEFKLFLASTVQSGQHAVEILNREKAN